MINKTVKVTMINIDWFHYDKNLFTDFADIVKDKPDEVYETEFVKYTLKQNWDGIRTNILKYRVLPHLLLTII